MGGSPGSWTLPGPTAAAGRVSWPPDVRMLGGSGDHLRAVASLDGAAREAPREHGHQNSPSKIGGQDSLVLAIRSRALAQLVGLPRYGWFWYLQLDVAVVNAKRLV